MTRTVDQNFLCPAYMQGWVPGMAGSSSINLNSANNLWAQSFILPLTGKTLSKVQFYVNSVTGTLGASSVVAGLYSSNGSPNTLIESRNTVTTTPTGATYCEVTGFTGTSALTAGTVYWIVISNADGTPASNYWQMIYQAGGGNLTPWWTGTGVGVNNLLTKTSTNAGSTWGSSVSNTCHIRLEFSDGSFWGFPVGGWNIAGASSRAYSTFELGAKITCQATGYIDGFMTAVGRTLNAQAGKCYGRIRINNGSPTQSDNYVTSTQITGNHFVTFYFSTPQLITAGDTLYFTIRDDNAETSSLYSYGGTYCTVANNAASQALMPFNGTLKHITTNDNTANPVVWTEVNSGYAITPLVLLYNNDTPFVGGGGAGYAKQIKRIGGRSLI